MRKLVTVRFVDEIHPIEGADAIELAVVDGWNVVVKKGEFSVGDEGLFFEIDSMIPVDDPRFEFLAAKAKGYNGKKMTRIRTMKMRGQISQGLLLPVDPFLFDIMRAVGLHIFNLSNKEFEEISPDGGFHYDLIFDADIAPALGVVKYERPDDSNLSGGRPAGDFPHYVPKTDQSRIQNLSKKIKTGDQSIKMVPTLKMDGSSTTVIYATDPKFFIPKLEADEDGGQLIICSRNQTLKGEEGCRWTVGVQNSGIDTAIKAYHTRTGRNIAIQGELVGPGIQRNHENHEKYTVYVFSVYDIDQSRYLDVNEFDDVMNSDEFGAVPTVPRFDMVSLDDFSGVDAYLSYANDVKSPFCKVPEGVVFHQKDSEGKPPLSFKAISNKYLLRFE